MKDEKAFKAFSSFKSLNSAIFCKMSKNYTHLSIDQRYQIEALLKTGATQKEIACIVHFHPSTISRELKRIVGSRGRGAGGLSNSKCTKGGPIFVIKKSQKE